MREREKRCDEPAQWEKEADAEEDELAVEVLEVGETAVTKVRERPGDGAGGVG